MNKLCYCWAWLSSLLLILLGCEQQAPVSSPINQFRLIKRIDSSATSLATTRYFYNSDNRLIQTQTQTLSYTGSNLIQTTAYRYDEQNRLIVIESQQGLALNKRVFTYNEQGDMVLSTDSSGFSNAIPIYTAQQQHAYRYDSHHLPYQETLTPLGTNPLQTYQYQYTYQQGNVSQVSITLPNGSTSQTTYQYDDKPNLWYGQWGSGVMPAVFSHNNVIFDHEQLSYTPQGLISQRETIYPTNRKLGSKISFIYETY
ncbi:hypothetical protein [Spirosoma radiotolerans]|uniref:YD repeat-containing protein n=1 Tax=Spirosoma radiotolerans TaxID=1379870 RepID=A0A0E3ZV87_9BACT|nr:hypothetical protein [Spirosoma radiotolerans]AKD54899.1 hypothetical protein SD10_08300 [Spirosoma radiotolerans]